MILIDNSEYVYFTFDESLLDTYVNTKIKDADYLFRIESTNDTIHRLEHSPDAIKYSMVFLRYKI